MLKTTVIQLTSFGNTIEKGNQSNCRIINVLDVQVKLGEILQDYTIFNNYQIMFLIWDIFSHALSKSANHIGQPNY